MLSNRVRIQAAAAAACGALLVIAAPAGAQSLLYGYSSTGGQVQSQAGTQPASPSQGTGPASHSSSPASTRSSASQAAPTPASSTPVQPATQNVAQVTPTGSSSSKGTLAFTGLDIGIVAGAGVLLIAGGLALRLLPRRHRDLP